MPWSRRTTFVSCLIALAAVALLVIMANLNNLHSLAAPRGRDLTLADIPFNGQRAYEHLQAICDIGPRITGSAGMLEQQELVTRHFESLGARVTPQEFFIRHPETGERTRIANLIVEF